ncbi:hypothetical protein [Prosthecobacter sp.]|uniref:hypothetical protein n=1 Tax=Prosthecobacter sp. TaxID=1965333 RepID=UPI0037841F6D
MKTAVLPIFFFVLANVCGAVAAEGKALAPPETNLPWEHEESGLRLPAELAKMQAQQVFRYDEAALGFSVRYSDAKARLRGDVYVYPCPKKVTTAEEIKEALRETAGGVVWEVEEMERRGHYKNLKKGKAEYQPFELIPEKAGVSGMLSLPMEMTKVEHGEAGDVEVPVGSFLGIMVLKSHFVKVRITYPLDGTEKEQEKVEKRVTDFVNQARRCVLDPGLREEAAEQIETYRRDSLSEEGREMAGGIFAYAEVTPIMKLTIDDTIATLGDDLEQVYPKASLELVRAFIVGAVAESLKKPGDVAPDLVQAGAAEMVRVFAAMQKAKPGLSSKRMEELETAVKGKKAAAWFKEAGKGR